MKSVIINCRAAALGLALSLGIVASYADEKSDYRKFSEEIKDWVYSLNLPAFEVREIPEKYKNESAVVIAVYDDFSIIRNTGDAKLHGAIGQKRDMLVEAGSLDRRLIYINDKTALDEFSEFDYETVVKNQGRRGAESRHRTVIGVKVIKPDGTERIIDTDDYLEVKEGKKGKNVRHKLAVPGLEVGDMIDMFTYIGHDLRDMHFGSQAFVLREEYPVMDYSIHWLIDGSFCTTYSTLNGAPEFTGAMDGSGNFRLDLNMKDLPAKPRLFYRDILQSPMIKLYIYDRYAPGFIPKSASVVGLRPAPDVESIKSEVWDAVRTQFFNQTGKKMLKSTLKDVAKAPKRLAEAYKSGEKSLIEVADCAYNLLAFSYLMSDEEPLPLLFELELRSILDDFVGDSLKTVMTTDAKKELLDGVTSVYAIATGSVLPGGKRYYFEPRAILAPSELHPDYAGRLSQEYTLKQLKDRKFKPDTTYSYLPHARASRNRKYDYMNVTIDGTDLNVERSTSCTGYAKLAAQYLLREEDVINGYQDYFNSWGFDIGVKGSEKRIAEKLLRYADDKATQTGDFKEEALSHHTGAEIDSVKGKITALGIDPKSPRLVYDMEYAIGGYVKRAGKNLLVDIGKLVDGPGTVLESDRKRTDMVVTRSPREYITKIELNLPEGAKVSEKTLESLTEKVQNAAGYFGATARVEDGKLIVETQLRFDRHFLESDQWPQMLELIDAANQWQGSSALIEM